jgi:hypothetical protein
MKGMVLNNVNATEVKVALALGRQRALDDADEIIQQLQDQLYAARTELQQEREACVERIEAARQRFLQEAREMQQIVHECIDEMRQLRMLAEIGNRTTQLLN